MSARPFRGRVLPALLLAACHSVPPAAGPQPALLDAPDAEAKLALRQAVQDLVGAPVLLADDAFETRDAIAVEPAQPREIDGRPLAGRVYGRPQTLRLLLIDGDCVLEHADSGEHRVVEGARCRVAPSV